jgi:hypothetical protein
MAIEIKELIIKTTIVQRAIDKDDSCNLDKETIKDEILAECKQLLQALLHERRER